MKISVVGSGTMGLGIATHIAMSGYEVILVAYKDERDIFDIETTVRGLVDKRYPDKLEFLKNIIVTKRNEDIIGSNLIIESVIEDLKQKRCMLDDISKYVDKDAILVSNTSSLLPTKIFEAIPDKTRLAGLHFFNPVFFMKLVEVVNLDNTSETVIEFLMDFATKLDKTSVIVKESSGYIVNRLLIPFINEAAKLVDEGVATVEDIDKAMMLGANHPIGPLKLSDMIGNDITYEILKNLRVNEISNELKNKVDANELGRKTKNGFYNYSR